MNAMPIHNSHNSPSAAGAVARDLSKLRSSAGKLVGSFFYGTLLQQMRESTLKAKYGHGGRGEEVFAAQLHDLLAQRMGTSSKGGLAEAVFSTLRKQQENISRQRLSDGEFRP